MNREGNGEERGMEENGENMIHVREMFMLRTKRRREEASREIDGG